MTRSAAILALAACAAALRAPRFLSKLDGLTDIADTVQNGVDALTSESREYDASDEHPLSLFPWDDYSSSADLSRSPYRKQAQSRHSHAAQQRPSTPRYVSYEMVTQQIPKVTVRTMTKDKVHKLSTVNLDSFMQVTATETPQPTTSIALTPRRPASTRRPPTTRRTTRRPSSTRPTIRRPATTKRTTRRPQPARLGRPPKKLKQPNKDCDESGGWFSSWFSGASNKIESPIGSGSNLFYGIYNFFSGFGDEDDSPEVEELDTSSSQSYSSWIGGFFERPAAPKPQIVLPPPTTSTTTTTTTTTSTTTTPAPTTTAKPGWFDSFLQFEEDDGAYSSNATSVTDQKKTSKRSYNGYQLLRVNPEVPWKVKELWNLQEETQGSGVMWWTSPSINHPTDILVPPDLLADVKDHMNAAGLEYDVVIWDLQKAIMYENPRLSKKQRLELEQTRGHPLTWRRYHRYADVLRYMEYLSHKYPHVVELVSLGRSAEGMPLMAAKVSAALNESGVRGDGAGGVSVSSASSNGSRKRWKLKSRLRPAVWVDAGAHACEWIAPAVATWMLHALVEGETGDGGDVELQKQADWYIMPVINPDGYEHSHTKDRLWRKTRSRHTNEDIYYNSWFPWNWGRTDCVGVDLNRNWDYHWGEKGSSRDPCSDQYAGPQPFSEPETKAVSNFLMDNKDQIKVYLSLHSYSQMWMVPSTHSRIPFADAAEVAEMGKLAASALGDIFGTKYQVGTAADLMQPSTGTSHDWAKGRAGVKYSYSVKMRDSYGPYGFLLPGSQIIPTARETWEGIKAIVDNL